MYVVSCVALSIIAICCLIFFWQGRMGVFFMGRPWLNRGLMLDRAIRSSDSERYVMSLLADMVRNSMQEVRITSNEPLPIIWEDGKSAFTVTSWEVIEYVRNKYAIERTPKAFVAQCHNGNNRLVEAEFVVKMLESETGCVVQLKRVTPIKGS